MFIVIIISIIYCIPPACQLTNSAKQIRQISLHAVLKGSAIGDRLTEHFKYSNRNFQPVH